MWDQVYHYAILALFAMAVVVFVALFFVTAPYGRHERPGWGITLPEKWGWGVMESPAVAVILVVFVVTMLRGEHVALTAVLFLALWQLHYVYRTFVFTALMRQGSKRFPVVLMVFAIVFNSANGFVNGYHLFVQRNGYTLHWLFGARFLCGAVLFIGGFIVHVSTDAALRALRPEGGTGYSIPRGGLFELVSSPNYLGEIVEWIGWALLTWSWAGAAFAAFTFANLFPRAISNHRWYRDTFRDSYPRSRKAIVPFIL